MGVSAHRRTSGGEIYPPLPVILAVDRLYTQ